MWSCELIFAFEHLTMKEKGASFFFKSHAAQKCTFWEAVKCSSGNPCLWKLLENWKSSFNTSLTAVRTFRQIYTLAYFVNSGRGLGIQVGREYQRSGRLRLNLGPCFLSFVAITNIVKLPHPPLQVNNTTSPSHNHTTTKMLPELIPSDSDYASRRLWLRARHCARSSRILGRILRRGSGEMRKGRRI
jgi:hypothetical protein